MRGLPSERVEAAAARALEVGALSYKGVISLLDARRHRSRPDADNDAMILVHANLRGPDYFH